VFVSQIQVSPLLTRQGELLVTSKHCIGGIHANKGTEWLHRHLEKSMAEFIAFLQLHNVTLVFELADDDFEGNPSF
jgi:tRNA splicing ligase